MSTIARFTLDEYDRLVESGALDKRRLELIRGEIREMSSIGPDHEDVVDQLTDWSTSEPIKKNESRTAEVKTRACRRLPGFPLLFPILIRAPALPSVLLDRKTK